MGWMGKIIGGTIGFALGGPLGAVAGAVFGHTFDTQNRSYFEGDYHTLSQEETSQLTFFVASFSMLAKLVQADGHIRREELDTIEKFMRRDLKLDSHSYQVASNIFQAALNSHVSFEQFASQFYQHFQYQPQMLDLMLDILFRVAQSDGRLAPPEEALILTATNIFNFSKDHYNRIKSRYIDDMDSYYATLQCRSDSSDEEIKRQYRKMVQEYHPDKIAAKGLPDEFAKFAADKFREIQEAYEKIKQQRGIK